MSSLSIRFPGCAKFWKKRSAMISDYDPSYKVIYLGNVLTGWAKGDGCTNKPLGTLWKNHLFSNNPDTRMKLTISSSGLKAITKEHGLTEYWANRITFCMVNPSYPKVFCWIYRHDGRKMKQELRFHAILCSSESKARQMALKLTERIHQAFFDFKKERISRQNARLSLANSTEEYPSLPFRKILLLNGSDNYRSPIEKSKTAPKLKAIEEVDAEIEKEEELRTFCDSSFEEEDSIPEEELLMDDPTSLYQKLRQGGGDLSSDEDEITDHLVAQEADKGTDDQDAISDESGYAEDPLRYVGGPDPSSSSDEEESNLPSISEEKKSRSKFDLTLDDLRPYKNNNKLIPEFCINI